jgi:23S rRNA (adenine-N6)-dimethyltransferase
LCDLVLDIGAGSGAITAVLARRCKSVIAYESEPRAADLLTKNMARYVNVTIKRSDFLAATVPETPYKVFANIPFHLSSPIVRKLVTAERAPTSVYLIVQKQFAQKMITTGSHFHGALGMSIAPWWVARIRHLRS